MQAVVEDRRSYKGKAIAYFFLSTIIIWLFIIKSPLYISQQQQLLSCSIAGAKWGIQIIAGLLLLQQKKWQFIKEIGYTCFIGSAILLPYFASSLLHFDNSAEFFIASLIVAVLSMIFLYYRAVKKCGLPVKWWLGWLACLAIAVTLQLTIVFHVL